MILGDRLTSTGTKDDGEILSGDLTINLDQIIRTIFANPILPQL